MYSTLGIPKSIDVLKQFRVIFNAVKQHFQQTESISRISSAQIWALSIISRNTGIRVSDLAEMMGIHQTTSSNLIYQLHRHKLITKHRQESDQRIVHLYPTEEGSRFLNRSPYPLEGTLPSALQKLSEGDLSELYLLLEKLITVLRLRDSSATEPKNIPLPKIVNSLPPCHSRFH